MVDFGDVSKIIPAQGVHIYRIADTNEIVLTSDIKFKGTHVIHRLNTRAGPIDTFEWRVREIEFTAANTEDLFTQLETDNQLGSRSQMTYNAWIIEGFSISGIGADDTLTTYSAALVDYEEIAPENGVDRVRIKLRILGQAF